MLERVLMDVKHNCPRNLGRLRPSNEIYLKNRKTYDNSKYFNQKTGEPHYPSNNGFVRKLNGTLHEGSKARSIGWLVSNNYLAKI
jgi:hypothetical protein